MFPEIFPNIATHCYWSGAVSSVWGPVGRRCSGSGEAPGTQTGADAEAGGGVVVDVDVDGVDVDGMDCVDGTPHYLQDGVGGRLPYQASMLGT